MEPKKMAIEIEAKVKVEQLEEYENRLKTLNAQWRETVHMQDIYLDRPDRSLLAADTGLRIREETTPDRHDISICYKGPRQGGKYKRRTELELGVTRLENARQLLANLGFQEMLSVTKTRQIWLIDQAMICLDTVKHLGTFIEIEGPDEATIETIATQLNIHTLAHIKEGYACMMAQYLKKNSEYR
ncbi:MAG: class IV adenylate cyclase [Phycisphaerae bacterium]|nr:class IV adenylate cyclase [Phycisphaerae bacterium]